MAKRPRDMNQLAKMVVDIATGELPNDSFDEPKGRAKGGHAGAPKLTPERRREIAMKGVAVRKANGRA